MSYTSTEYWAGFRKVVEEGFTLIDALAALLVFMILLGPIVYMVSQGRDEVRKQSVATHFRTIAAAAEVYAKQNYGTLLDQSTATSGPTITLTQLRSSGALASRVKDTNAWNQSYSIQSRKTAEGDLAMVVLTTGGRGQNTRDPAFANVMVPSTAALAGAGYIPTGVIGSSASLRGAYGTWEVTLASMGLTGTPGHLGLVSTFSASDLGQDYLYRIAVPGHPELNEMATTLDMTDHAIAGVASLQFSGHRLDDLAGFCSSGSGDEGKVFHDPAFGLYLCRDGAVTVIGDTGNSLMIKEMRLAQNNETIDKPLCPTGSNTVPQIFVSPSILSAGPEAPTIASVQAWATEVSDTSWQVRMRLLTSEDEWVYPAANYGRMVVVTSCARSS